MWFFIAASGDDGRSQADVQRKEKRSFREIIFDEVLPFYLSIGLSEEHFWSANPKELEPYMKAHKLQLEREDRNNYNLGLYMLSAFGAVIGSAFGNKKAKYVDEPFMESAKKNVAPEDMDEETKTKYAEQLFARLGTMQTNFELEQKRKAQEEQKKTS